MAGIIGQAQQMMETMEKAMQPPPPPQIPTPPPPMSPAAKEFFGQPGAPPMEAIMAELMKRRSG